MNGSLDKETVSFPFQLYNRTLLKLKLSRVSWTRTTHPAGFGIQRAFPEHTLNSYFNPEDMNLHTGPTHRGTPARTVDDSRHSPLGTSWHMLPVCTCIVCGGTGADTDYHHRRGTCRRVHAPRPVQEEVLLGGGPS